MAGTINEFKNSFRSDIARSNRFDVLISPPLTLLSVIAVTPKQLAFRCENAQLPGRSIATTDRKTYGPIEKLPYLTTYNDIDLTFIVSGDMSEKLFFDTWLDLVNPKTTNNFNYKTDYSTPVIINQYGVDNKLTYSVELIDAYPISVNQLDLDWASDSVHKLTVTFAYTKWFNNSVTNYLL